MPQVTLQHSLAYTMPLVASLFVNKDGATRILPKLASALPLLDTKNKLIEESNYFTEENGLIFLHALTCTSMQHYKSENLEDIVDSLDTIKSNFDEYKQVDAKISLSFGSSGFLGK
jgi:hypothetical protein